MPLDSPPLLGSDEADYLPDEDLVLGAASIFGDNHERRQKADEALVARLYQQIGQLKVELDFLEERSGP